MYLENPEHAKQRNMIKATIKWLRMSISTINAPKAILLTRMLSNSFQIPAQEMREVEGKKHESQGPNSQKMSSINKPSAEAKFNLQEKHKKLTKIWNFM